MDYEPTIIPDIPENTRYDTLARLSSLKGEHERKWEGGHNNVNLTLSGISNAEACNLERGFSGRVSTMLAATGLSTW